MPNPNSALPPRPIKMLYMGHTSAGKTGSTIALAAGGFNVRVLDLDNGYEILKDLASNPKSPYTKAHPKGLWTADQAATVGDRVSWVTITESYSTIGVKAIPKGDSYQRITAQLNSWNDGAERLGHISTWGPNDVLVFDGLSRFTEAAMSFQLAMNNRLISGPQVGTFGGNDYTQAYRMVTDILDMLKSEAVKCNVIMICHIQFMEEPGVPSKQEGSARRDYQGFPQTVGRQIAPKIGQYFNHALRAKRSGSGDFVRRTIVTRVDENVDLKNPAPYTVAQEYPLETGLLEYFRAIRGTEVSPKVAGAA